MNQFNLFEKTKKEMSKKTSTSKLSNSTKTHISKSYSKLHELKLINIGLASPQSIKQWAEKTLPNGKIIGQITNANTLHHKTLKPQKGGLFCERIFGPLKDFECACGKNQKPNEEKQEKIFEHQQLERSFCPKCDVEYTWSVIRRYQLGYIQLVSPVTHAWYLKATPSYLSILLDIKKRHLESIIYSSETMTLEYSQKLTEQNFNSPATLFQIWQKSIQTVKTGKNILQTNFDPVLTNSKKTDLLKYQDNIIFSSLNNFSPALDPNYIFMKNLAQNKDALLTSEEIVGFEVKITNIQPKRWKAWRTGLINFNDLTFWNKNISEYDNITKNIKNKNIPLIPVMIYILNKIQVQSTKKSIILMKQQLFKEFYTKLYNLAYKEIKKYRHKKYKYVSLGLNNQNPINLKIYLVQKIKKIFNNSVKINYSFQKKSKKVSLYKKFLSQIISCASFSTTQPLSLTGQSLFIKKLDKKFNLFNKFLESIDPQLTAIIKKLIKNKSNLFSLINNLMIVDKSSNFINKSDLDITNLFSNESKKNIATNNQFNFKQLPSDTAKFINLYSPAIVPEKINMLSKHQDSMVQKYFYCLNIDSTSLLLTKLIINIFLKKMTNLIQSYSKIIFKSMIKSNIKLEVKKFKMKHNFSQFDVINYVLPNTTLLLSEFKTHEIVYKTKLMNKNKQLSFNLNRRKISNFVPYTSITNNIYYLSHRHRWKSEKDWKQFFDYIGSPPELTDMPIPIYKFRITNSQNLVNENGLTGTILIQKLLQAFNFKELKKIDKQNRILLYFLNKKLIKLKKSLKTTYADRHNKKKLFKELYKNRDGLMRRTKLIRKLFRKDSRPEGMILSILPVLPPDLRPIIKVGGQIAASDLNRLYQRVIYRNERLKKFLKDPATMNSYEMKYAQRLLQEAVDNLIQNGNSGLTAEKDSKGRLFKSLSDILKGKQGRFRQHLLGKRVDYSGRSVIVVGPKLKLYECGLPKEMALELFLPFIIKKMISLKLARTVIGAKTLIKNNKEITYDILKEIMKNHPILLNRAPTLHRLGIQSFQPKLVDGRAILLHPLVCPAFNADFDGDQMAVHIPITIESRVEAWKLMFSRTNLLSPATGEPIVLPSQDMVLGCYYLTTENLKASLTPKIYFSNLLQVLKAYKQGKINVHTVVWVRYEDLVETGGEEEQPLEIRINKNGLWQEIYKTTLISYDLKAKKRSQFIKTTPGRILFNELIKNSLQLNSKLLN